MITYKLKGVFGNKRDICNFSTSSGAEAVNIELAP
jgi:hypothetical protein